MRLEKAQSEVKRRLPERRSVVSRVRAPKPSLLRLVLGPDKRPFVDVIGRAPGRATYVKPDCAELLEALSPKGVARAFKGMAVALDAPALETVVDDTIRRIEERILELVSLARRARRVEIGMDAMQRSAQDGSAVMLIAARDLSERSDRALPAGLPIVRVANKQLLGSRLGRQEVGVLAVLESVFKDRLAWEAERLSGLETTRGAVSGPSTNAVRRGRVQADVAPRLQATRDND